MDDKKKESHDGFVIKLALIASMSGLLFGYDTGVVSGAIIYLRPHMELSNVEEEIIVSSTILSAAVSAFIGHHMMDSKGRKYTLVVASLIFVLGSLVMGIAFGDRHGYIMLLVGRILVGAAIGLASDAGPLYISECAPPNLRGSLTTLFNIAVVGGQIFASVVCGIFSYLPIAYNWRCMLAFGAVPALAQMIGFSTLPLSPSWLVLKNKEVEAEKVLRRIRMAPKQEDGVVKNDYEDHVMEELREIKQEVHLAKQHQHVTLRELWFNNRPVRRMMMLGCSLWAVSQLAGINTIMYYGASIVRRSGIEGDRTFDIWITVPLNTMQLIGIFVCFSIIDKKGRRPTLLLSMTMVCFSLILIGTGFATGSSLLTIIAMCAYLFSFGVGLSTMPYTMNSEIYPTEYRGVCVAQATGVFWMSNFIVSVTFLTLAKYMSNAGVFFLYAGIVIVSEIIFYFKVPETAGLSLHKIQALFEDQSEEAQPLPHDHEDVPHYDGTGTSEPLEKKELEML
eukprot:scaffold45806_cov237-Amphora_coffeaeformis.AAC.5